MANLLKCLIAVFVCLQTSVLANADENQTYLLITKETGEAGITFQVPYTAGVHAGEALGGEGSIELSSDGKILEGSFIIPLVSVVTGNQKRDCHLLEAMGLDYTKSRYPNEHVCGATNQLPTTGPDALAYTTIDFDITKFEETSNAEGVIKGTVTGEWSMHGVTKTVSAPIEATKTADGYRVKSKFNLSLAAFGIFVKPVLVVSVKDTVTVNLDMEFQKKP